MNPAKQDGTAIPGRENQASESSPAEVVPIRPVATQRDSLSENFHGEIDAWARQALASNGFADAI